ncbi:MAG: DUF1015 domain-containing protein [Flavobacteriales bacterium]
MSKIAAFKAIRPVRDKVHLVATRPYYSYKKNVLKAKLEDNPFTFLHIINPEFNKSVKTKPNSKERFALVKNQFDQFLKDGILIQDSTEHLYIYRQSKGDFSVIGVIGGASVQEYIDNDIKKHEQTLTVREEVFTQYLDQVGFNAEPVLMTYDPQNELNSLIESVSAERPEYEFTTTDCIKHELWVLNTDQTKKCQDLFQQVDALYIADGHHRSASSVRYAQLKEEQGKTNNETGFFLSYIVAKDQVKILAFHRLLKSLNGFTKESFVRAMSDLGKMTPISKAAEPEKEKQFTICIGKDWYLFEPDSTYINDSNPVEQLDSFILSDLILKPLLGIVDLKTSDQVEFVPGNESLSSIEDKIRSGKFELGFILHPATIEQVKEVADAGMNMPPKSTWVEPKLRSGLTIYQLHS